MSGQDDWEPGMIVVQLDTDGAVCDAAMLEARDEHGWKLRGSSPEHYRITPDMAWWVRLTPDNVGRIHGWPDWSTAAVAPSQAAWDGSTINAATPGEVVRALLADAQAQGRLEGWQVDITDDGGWDLIYPTD